MYQCVTKATATPTRPASGNHTARQRRERHPTANVSTTAVHTWTVTGTQPCIRET
jgi:hypothetical protein